MYVGHFAAGLALKAVDPRAPTWGLLLAVGLLDLLFGPFVILGIERVSLTPGQSPGFSLDFIDWSHSLLMSAIWAIVFAGFFYRWGFPVMLAIGAAVFSHFLLDIPMHPPDLALWPGSSTHIGLGLWQTFPAGWWFIELGVILVGWGFYYWKSRGSPSFGGRPVAAGIVLLVLHLSNSPWLSIL